jgi:hypothetical protein
MISVIICSVNPDLLKKITENIQKTIGIPFEILFFDNRIAKKGICAVYNELASKSKFEYLCFIHEDVLLKTENWGNKINGIFLNNPNIGLIGIAGSKYKSAYFSGWYTGVKELDCANYIHQYSSKTEHVFLSPSQNRLEEVVCIDGVFMLTTKTAWSKIVFDEKLLKGFHFYDIDFSVRMAHEYKVVVTFDIQLVHITSGGDYSNNWVQTAILYHQKKKDILPFSKTSLIEKRIDKKVIITTMDHLKNYKIDLLNKIKWIVFQKLYLNPLFYYGIFKFILYQPLGLKKIDPNRKNK